MRPDKRTRQAQLATNARNAANPHMRGFPRVSSCELSPHGKPSASWGYNGRGKWRKGKLVT